MNKVSKVLLKSFFTNITLSIIKIISGILGASGALIADGIHSLSDTMTDVFAIIGHKLSNKPADHEHPHGHGKIEYITCIIIGFIVMFMGLTIIYEAIYHQRTTPSIYVAIISLLTIFAKLLLSKYLLKKGKEYSNNILIASGKESTSDVLSSIVVLISILISQLFVYADMLAMIIVGILILNIAYNIFKDNFSNLLGKQVTDEEYITKLEKIIKKEKEVMRIDLLIVLKYGPSYQLNCEVGMDENMKLKEVHSILEKIESNLKKYDEKIKNITIHVNPYKQNDQE